MWELILQGTVRPYPLFAHGMSFADGEHLAATANTHKLMTGGAGELGCYCRHTQIDDRGQELNVDEYRQKGGFPGLANTIQSQFLQSFGSLFWRVPNNTRLGGTINIFSASVGMCKCITIPRSIQIEEATSSSQ